MLTNDHKMYIERSVLAWLATASQDNMPNVSPKEIFTHWDNKYILVANIASPNTVKNIKTNAQVCLSVLDIFIQKGFQFKGTAELISQEHQDWKIYSTPLIAMAGEKFPFRSLTKITINSTKAILAPSYLFFPETREADQIEAAKKTYGLDL